MNLEMNNYIVNTANLEIFTKTGSMGCLSGCGVSKKYNISFIISSNIGENPLIM